MCCKHDNSHKALFLQTVALVFRTHTHLAVELKLQSPREGSLTVADWCFGGSLSSTCLYRCHSHHHRTELCLLLWFPSEAINRWTDAKWFSETVNKHLYSLCVWWSVWDCVCYRIGNVTSNSVVKELLCSSLTSNSQKPYGPKRSCAVGQRWTSLVRFVWTKAPAEPGDFKTKVLACIISQPKGDCLRMQLFFRGVHRVYGLFSFAFAFLAGEWVWAHLPFMGPNIREVPKVQTLWHHWELKMVLICSAPRKWWVWLFSWVLH